MPAFSITGESVTCAFPDPGVGVTISIPPDSIVWADTTLSVSAGKSIRVPVDSLTLTSKVLRVSSGKSVRIQADSIVWVDKVLRVSSGVRLSIPRDAILWTDPTPRISAGRMISISVTIDMRIQLGVTGEDVTAEYITLDGALSTRPAQVPDRLVFTTNEVDIRAGASLRVPFDAMTITQKVFELGARRRRIKTSSIAS